MSEQGTKETLEVIELVATLAGLIFKEIRGDGLQLSDAAMIVLSPDFQTKLAVALAGITLVREEIDDLSVPEGFTIAKRLLTVAEDIVVSTSRAA
ncbi:MAG TPA: hypothetical protein VE954_22120 [Oligoflexus sp.]|uniref:hypothetical protein n=1 Tax=Oligoflexus sp. TaxID=1971216 RepID=UPI002D675762|nr:hypothetical protein [Oligoflexus sp.]HYX35804.1 hypothetical protein [Oligoflexus sp.]